MMPRPSEFVSNLCALSFADVFNPYADRCPVYDKDDAPRRRTATLLAMLKAASKCEVDSIWIGRDLGYRGGRRTGLALTDDVHIALHARRWGVAMYRPTKGQAVAERTAAVIWSVLDRIEVPVFLWNVFPLHPHEVGEPFSNRAHNSQERAAGEDVLAEIIALIAPKRIIAIGNDAAKSAARVSPDKKAIQVRHPSYGGQNEFLTQMKSLYRYRTDTLF
jgi:uracil DNA glycosylase superfamily protein